MGAAAEAGLDIVAVGSWTNFDHIFCVDKLPEPGETVEITSPIQRVEAKTFGGTAPNNAAAAASLGFKAGLVSVVGEDFVSNGYQAHLRDLGVDQNGVILVGGALCGHSFLFTGPDGETICISHTGVAGRQAQYDPDPHIISRAKSVVLNYRFDDFTLNAGKIAQKAGSLVAVSGAVAAAPEIIEELITLADVLFGTRFELQALAQSFGSPDARGLLDQGVKVIFQTEGKKGSQVITTQGATDVPIVQAKQVVDTVGAGDAYVGAAVACLGRGYPAVQAARVAATLASFVVEEWGCQTGLPARQAFRERYQSAWQESVPEI